MALERTLLATPNLRFARSVLHFCTLGPCLSIRPIEISEHKQGGRFSPRPSRAEAVRSLRRPAHWYYTIGGGAYGQVKEVAFPVEAAAKTIHAILQGGPSELPKAVAEFVRECQLMSIVYTPPERRPVSGRRLLPRLATARPRHGATADESSRLAGSRHAAPARRPLAASLLLCGSQVLRAAQRGVRPGLPARAIAARHPPRLVGQKRSPELGDGGKDRRFGRGSYRASYESCSHHDNGTWGFSLHASRGQCSCLFTQGTGYFRLYAKGFRGKRMQT